MVCIAAFIVLGVIVLFLPILRIFNKELSNKIWKMFKFAAGCFGRRVTFQKCEVSMKDQVKNSMLKKVVLRRPSWVKPLGVVIEVAAVAIILTTVWSLLVGAKSLTALAAYGTCDIITPEACLIGDAEFCSVVGGRTADNPAEWVGNWFVEWGEAFGAIPPRLMHWEASDFIPEGAVFYNCSDDAAGVAISIFDPGCRWCRESYQNQKNAGFLNEYRMAMIPYALRDDGENRFANSDLIVRFIEATRLELLVGAGKAAEWLIVDRLFTQIGPRQVLWQEDFNNYYSDTEARGVLEDWLREFGYTDAQVQKIVNLVDSDEVATRVDKNRDMVENQIKIVKIPTGIFDGKRHDGVFR